MWRWIRAALAALLKRVEGSRSAARFQSVEGTRALAALLIFFFHMGFRGPFRVPPGTGWAFLERLLLSAGPLGTSCFLVISGCFIYRSLLRGGETYGSFVRRRLFRIYPLYLIVLSVYVAFSLMLPGVSRIPPGAGEAAVYVLAHATLLIGLMPVMPMMTVGWTLTYIVGFYLLSPLLIRTSGLYRLAKWQRAGVLALLAVSSALWLRTAHSGAPRIAFFFVGMLVWEFTDWVVDRGGNLAWLPGVMKWVALVALILFIAAGPDPYPDQPGGPVVLSAWRFTVATVFFFGFCFCVFGGHPGLSRFLSSPPLRLLGGVSYSFYLTHGLTLNVLDRAFHLSGETGDPTPALAFFWLPLAYLVSASVAVVCFLLVERHFIRRPAVAAHTVASGDAAEVPLGSR